MKNLNVIQYFVYKNELLKALEELKNVKSFDQLMLGQVEEASKAIEEMIKRGETEIVWRTLASQLILSFRV